MSQNDEEVLQLQTLVVRHQLLLVYSPSGCIPCSNAITVGTKRLNNQWCWYSSGVIAKSSFHCVDLSSVSALMTGKHNASAKLQREEKRNKELTANLFIVSICSQFSRLLFSVMICLVVQILLNLISGHETPFYIFYMYRLLNHFRITAVKWIQDQYIIILLCNNPCNFCNFDTCKYSFMTDIFI